MKLDHVLMDKLLYFVEAQHDWGPHVVPKGWLEDYTRKQIMYHIEMCSQAGYVRAAYAPSYFCSPGKEAEVYYRIGDLTWEGHQYLKDQREREEKMRLRKKGYA